MDDLISRQAVLGYIDRVLTIGTGKKKSLDFVRKYIETLPSAESEQIARDIATIIENEKDMRVILKNAQPKKKMTFSERIKIVREYQDWCLFNNAVDCAESFLAYLCIKGYIDG